MKSKFVLACLLALVIVPALRIALPCRAEADNPGKAPGAEIRVMSYNIMHPDWSRVAVTGRDETVAGIIDAYRPDVVALQEAGAKWHKALKPLLVDTGLYAQACRQSHADGFIYCTTTFLYNPETLDLVEEYILDLERNHATRVLAVAVFERRSDGARFVVANTHPAITEEVENYERNMADIVRFVGDIMNGCPDLPLIIMGDFNTPEQSDMYLRFMEETGLGDAKYEAETLAQDCSTYFGYTAEIDTGDRSQCIDHIFVSEKVDVKLFDIVVDGGVQDASDHVPIYADIALR